ncbi:unnamed protein product [Diplocarpon coronariae]|uniref:Uncharacterized protein n=1 Tax=Diplocarpon coronariae TaxID=2795749 RepID=A0A218Z507_9HELO|nr:hypothetical protein B2J93_1296 [Marssonina coronariae]
MDLAVHVTIQVTVHVSGNARAKNPPRPGPAAWTRRTFDSSSRESRRHWMPGRREPSPRSRPPDSASSRPVPGPGPGPGPRRGPPDKIGFSEARGRVRNRLPSASPPTTIPRRVSAADADTNAQFQIRTSAHQGPGLGRAARRHTPRPRSGVGWSATTPLAGDGPVRPWFLVRSTGLPGREAGIGCVETGCCPVFTQHLADPTADSMEAPIDPVSGRLLRVPASRDLRSNESQSEAEMTGADGHGMMDDQTTWDS